MNYTEMSKLLGWNSIPITIPSDEEVDSLIENASKGDSDSYLELFRINRFAPSTEENVERVNKVFRAFSEYRKLYE